MIQRELYLEYVIRWWPLPTGGAILGLVYSLVRNVHPFPGIVKRIPTYSASLGDTFTIVSSPGWKDDVLLVVIGTLAGFGLIWFLEEFRGPEKSKEEEEEEI